MIFYQYAVRKTRRIIEQHNNFLQPDRILRVYARLFFVAPKARQPGRCLRSLCAPLRLLMGYTNAANEITRAIVAA
ncbi:MAG: hypothetical protein DU429_02470 [Candidatus Tokpelaia sp.]|nr:MAG: hypothetical protein DU430_05220 [Candidatus Tokpelaia sp.]KAA6207348.1 MAG: hypothetical protein DU429_02470 [Candidatus Tokpelaia sp.]